MVSRAGLLMGVLILCCWVPSYGQSHQQQLRDLMQGIWWSPDVYQSAAFQIKDSTIYYPDDFAEYRYNISGDTIVVHRADAVLRSTIIKATSDSLILSSFGREWIYTRAETKRK